MRDDPEQIEGPPDPEKKWRIDWLALAAPSGFILSIVSLLTCGLVSPLAILVCSFGLFRSRRGLAIAGMVLSLVSLFPRFCLRTTPPSTLTRVRWDMNPIMTAIESYMVDHGTFPRGPSFAELSPEQRGRKRWKDPQPPAWSMTDSSLLRLTQPPPYLDKLARDQFREDRRTFEYFADEGGWILVSPGPDGDYDLNAPDAYVSSIAQPSAMLLTSGTYDPTNGTISDGDVWRVRQ